MFYRNTALATVTYDSSNSLDYIGYYAFYKDIALTTFTYSVEEKNYFVIPESITTFGLDGYSNSGAFRNTGVVTLELLTTATGPYLFEGCSNLAIVYLNDEIKTISAYQFYNDQKVHLLISNKYKDTINAGFNLSESIVRIGSYAFFNFYDEAMNSIDMEHNTNLEIVEYASFGGWRNLRSVVMPFVGYQYGVYSGVENGANRFDHTFSSGDSDSNYYVSATYWMPKIEYVRITADTALGQYAFYRNSTIETLILPNTLNSIGLDLLRGTTNLQNLTIPFVGNTRGITNKVEATFGYFYYNSESSIETIMQYYVAPNTLPVNGEGVLLSDLKASSSLDESDIDFSYASDVLASSSNANKAVTTTDSDGNKHYVPVGTYHSEVTVGYGYIPSRNLKIVSITDETVIGTGAFMNFSHIEQIKLMIRLH